jgi:hypothetical protein
MKVFKELSDSCEGYESSENNMIQEMENLFDKAKHHVGNNRSSTYQMDGTSISLNLPIEKDEVYHRKRGYRGC